MDIRKKSIRIGKCKRVECEKLCCCRPVLKCRPPAIPVCTDRNTFWYNGMSPFRWSTPMDVATAMQGQMQLHIPTLSAPPGRVDAQVQTQTPSSLTLPDEIIILADQLGDMRRRVVPNGTNIFEYIVRNAQPTMLIEDYSKFKTMYPNNTNIFIYLMEQLSQAAPLGISMDRLTQLMRDIEAAINNLSSKRLQPPPPRHQQIESMPRPPQPPPPKPPQQPPYVIDEITIAMEQIRDTIPIDRIEIVVDRLIQLMRDIEAAINYLPPRRPLLADLIRVIRDLKTVILRMYQGARGRDDPTDVLGSMSRRPGPRGGGEAVIAAGSYADRFEDLLRRLENLLRQLEAITDLYQLPVTDLLNIIAELRAVLNDILQQSGGWDTRELTPIADRIQAMVGGLEAAVPKINDPIITPAKRRIDDDGGAGIQTGISISELKTIIEDLKLVLSSIRVLLAEDGLTKLLTKIDELLATTALLNTNVSTKIDQVVGELRKQTSSHTQMEKTLTELIDEIKKRLPLSGEQEVLSVGGGGGVYNDELISAISTKLEDSQKKFMESWNNETNKLIRQTWTTLNEKWLEERKREQVTENERWKNSNIPILNEWLKARDDELKSLKDRENKMTTSNSKYDAWTTEMVLRFDNMKKQQEENISNLQKTNQAIASARDEAITAIKQVQQQQVQQQVQQQADFLGQQKTLEDILRDVQVQQQKVKEAADKAASASEAQQAQQKTLEDILRDVQAQQQKVKEAADKTAEARQTASFSSQQVKEAREAIIAAQNEAITKIQQTQERAQEQQQQQKTISNKQQQELENILEEIKAQQQTVKTAADAAVAATIALKQTQQQIADDLKQAELLHKKQDDLCKQQDELMANLKSSTIDAPQPPTGNVNTPQPPSSDNNMETDEQVAANRIETAILSRMSIDDLADKVHNKVIQGIESGVQGILNEITASVKDVKAIADKNTTERKHIEEDTAVRDRLMMNLETKINNTRISAEMVQNAIKEANKSGGIIQSTTTLQSSITEMNTYIENLNSTIQTETINLNTGVASLNGKTRDLEDVIDKVKTELQSVGFWVSNTLPSKNPTTTFTYTDDTVALVVAGDEEASTSQIDAAGLSTTAAASAVPSTSQTTTAAVGESEKEDNEEAVEPLEQPTTTAAVGDTTTPRQYPDATAGLLELKAEEEEEEEQGMDVTSSGKRPLTEVADDDDESLEIRGRTRTHSMVLRATSPRDYHEATVRRTKKTKKTTITTINRNVTEDTPQFTPQSEPFGSTVTETMEPQVIFDQQQSSQVMPETNQGEPPRLIHTKEEDTEAKPNPAILHLMLNPNPAILLNQNPMTIKQEVPDNEQPGSSNPQTVPSTPEIINIPNNVSVDELKTIINDLKFEFSHRTKELDQLLLILNDMRNSNNEQPVQLIIDYINLIKWMEYLKQYILEQIKLHSNIKDLLLPYFAELTELKIYHKNAMEEYLKIQDDVVQIIKNQTPVTKSEPPAEDSP
jgi:hypothetical protein